MILCVQYNKNYNKKPTTIIKRYHLYELFCNDSNILEQSVYDSDCYSGI